LLIKSPTASLGFKTASFLVGCFELWIKSQPAGCPGQVRLAMDDAAINYNSGPNSCPDGQINDIFLAASSTPPGLTFDISCPIADS